MKWPRRQRIPLSREGMLWFGISFAMLVTGLFKGINLITLLACWMVILVFVNYLWAYPQMRHISVRRFFPDPAFAETPFTYLLQVENGEKKNAFGISIHDAGPEHQAARFLPKLAAKSSINLGVTLKFPQRGPYRLEPLRLTTGYPLALVHLTKLLQESADLVVYPKLGSLQLGKLRRFLAQHSPTLGQARAFPRRHPAAQMEFHGLRPFRVGDSPRWIHWRTTARRGELIIREFEDMPNDHLVLIVDPGLEGNLLLERVLSLAATICWEWCRQKDIRLALAVAGSEPAVLSANTGRDNVYAMLERLALTNPYLKRNDAAFLHALGEMDLPPGPVLVLSATASELAGMVNQFLHRSVAQLILGRDEEKDFFEML